MEPVSCIAGRFFTAELPGKPSPGGSDSKESACNVGNSALIPESGRFPGEENGYPLQYSCLENSMREEPGSL